MNLSSGSRFIQRQWSLVVQSNWLRLRDWMWYFAPGIVCCILCWAFFAAITLASVQVFWQRKSASLQELSDREAMVLDAQAETLIKLRASFWQQGAPALTVAMPARSGLAAAFTSAAGQGKELSPPEGSISAPSPEAWSGLLWLDHAAVGHGLAVELLQRVEPKPEPEPEPRSGEAEALSLVELISTADAYSANREAWVALDLRLTGSRFALAGFLLELAASSGVVRAEQFTIDVVEQRADLRLLYNLQRPPPPAIPATLAARGAEEPSALCGEPSALFEDSSTRKQRTSGQAILWRAGHVSSWWRQPGGEVIRAAPDSKAGAESSERLSP